MVEVNDEMVNDGSTASAVAEDSCATCKGTQGPDHVHACDACGADPGPGVLIIGDDSTEIPVLVCDRFCLHEVDPNSPYLADVPPEYWEAGREKKKVIQEMRALKQRASKAGVPWN